MRYFNTSSAEKISKKPSRRPENPETYARPRWLTSNGEEIGKGRRSRVVIPRRVRILARVSVHACTSPSAVRWRTEAARSNDPPSPPLAASGRRLRLVLNQIRASLHSPTAPQALSRGGGRTRKEPRRKKKLMHPYTYYIQIIIPVMDATRKQKTRANRFPRRLTEKHDASLKIFTQSLTPRRSDFLGQRPGKKKRGTRVCS